MFQGGDYVINSGGTRLLRVAGPERRYGRDGYVVTPLNNGTGDGYGYRFWVGADVVKLAPLEWTAIPGGLQERWTFRGALAVREIRRTPAEKPTP